MRPYLMGALALLLFIGLSPGPVEAAPQEAPAAEDLGIACADCHDEVVAKFAANPHARGRMTDRQVPNEVCISCHGDATAHIEAGGDPTLIYVPRGLEGADRTCLTCHSLANEDRSHRTGPHANSATVNCLTCHEIHHAESLPRPALLVADQMRLCGTCHGPEAAQFRNKAHTHPLDRGAMACSSCHEPHRASTGERNIRRVDAGQPVCLECHSDKRGPHVFPHGARDLGDCTTCHQPHGSNNPMQLTRANVFQLCLECHSPIGTDTLGSQPPSFHNLNNPRFRHCTTCHVAVHGSNRSPALLK